MRGLSGNRFHALLMLTERPGQWPAWRIAPIAILLASGAGLLWAAVVGQSWTGWLVAWGLLAFALFDWALLAALPRWQFSFGAVQPPWLGLVILRWSITLLSVLFAAQWLLPTLAVLAGVQVLVFLMAAWGTMVEPFRLQISEVEIATGKLAEQATPVRIVQVSDLHVERLTRRERALPDLVAGLNPDIIVLTGDFLSTSYHDDSRSVDDLREILAELRAPGGIFAVWGTVEVDLPHVLHPVLDDLGIVVLEDRAVEVTIRDNQVWLMGLNCTRDLDAEASRLHSLLASAPPGASTVLLYHMPDLMPKAAALGVDLHLAGHTHGGQWCVPGFGAILTSSRYWKKYEAGYYCEARTQLYVSRGLGMEGFGTPRARFFCPPELVLVKLVGLREEG